MTPAPIVCLRIEAPKALEEKLVDMLLEHELTATNGFTTRDVHGHGAEVSYGSIAEQIAGRIRLIEINVVMSDAEAEALLEEIRRALPCRGIVFTLTALTASGVIA